ncbi:MAG: N-acetylneuraminate synthase [Bdellovibrionales bacterium GWA2_49_15]|nr:MAG: N-acetylneuraminate synthase [Bdellovibrionales bacterium GWA2_49_15]
MRKTYIIAEAGVNHNGDLKLAKKLVDVAVDAKADAVKFQTFKTEKIVTKSASKAAYQNANEKQSSTQFEMLKKLELSHPDHHELFAYCEKRQIQFLSTPFDLESADFLCKLGVPIFKIPSGEITNLPLLKKIAGFKKSVILSSGMSTLDDIQNALEVLRKYGCSKEDISVLHCCTEYPTPFNAVNLNAMQTIREKFNVKVGYSDHTRGTSIPIAAVALGAQIIEKHFTLDKNLAGPDHLASLDPAELRYMVQEIRNIELALGDGLKLPAEVELKNMQVVRKSIVAAKKIKKGEIFSEENLTVKRPGTGISPLHWDEFIGRPATKDYEEDELL